MNGTRITIEPTYACALRLSVGMSLVDSETMPLMHTLYNLSLLSFLN